jgi:hypothetical protein
MCDSKPLILQNVSGSSHLTYVAGEMIFLQDTTNSLFASSGQHTTQVVIGFCFLEAFF